MSEAKEKIRSMIEKVTRAYRKGGIESILWRGLRKSYTLFLRPLMPRRNGVYNEIEVRKAKFLEETLGYDEINCKNFEDRNVKALKDKVKPDDEVLILGGVGG